MQLLIEIATKALVIAALTSGVLRLASIKTAAARHAFWTGVLAIMLVLPISTTWAPRVAIRVLPPLPARTSVDAGANKGGLQPSALPSAVAMPEFTAPAPPIPRASRWNWESWLFGIYFVGVCLLLLRLAVGTFQAHTLVRRARRRDGRLFSSRCGAPVTLGWFRPVVVLPEAASEWTAEQLDAVLAHEQEHARRRDPLIQWLALLNRAVFWFHPLAWLLEKRLATLAEEACDTAVMQRGHDPRAYSQYLIEMARSVASRGGRVQVWGMPMPGICLEQRIRRIIDGGVLARNSRTRIACATSVWILSVTISGASGLDHQYQTESAIPQFSSITPDISADDNSGPAKSMRTKSATVGMLGPAESVSAAQEGSASEPPDELSQAMHAMMKEVVRYRGSDCGLRRTLALIVASAKRLDQFGPSDVQARSSFRATLVQQIRRTTAILNLLGSESLDSVRAVLTSSLQQSLGAGGLEADIPRFMGAVASREHRVGPELDVTNTVQTMIAAVRASQGSPQQQRVLGNLLVEATAMIETFGSGCLSNVRDEIARVSH